MEKVISKDGTAIAYTKKGQGAPLILVDGAICYRAFGPMEPLSALLADHFTVYLYDRRGRGESGDTAPYAVQREVEDIAALIQEAGESAFVYGTSSGAALALEAAASGLKIKKLALYEPPFNDAATQANVEYTTRLKQALAQGNRGDAVVHFMTYVGTPAEAVVGMQQAPIWPMFEAVAPTLAYDAAVLGDASVPVKRAATITIPTLIMTGGATFPFMHESAQTIHEAIPGSQRRTLEGQTHDAAADVVAPALIEFFAS